ncbi:UNVERIFIED_CONTAM: hypothetical protein Slati_1963300 [Sesamum latifolium]|uniref:Reverse transcriptase zinc-binding domain-containing protein n=1 Tax=Sesamum latifolium TaxID=2727402 RepID=A0AAW2WRD6_9LAMI
MWTKLEVILGIPLSRTGEPDLLVWHYSKNGRFSVRSAYHLACLMDDRPGSSSLGEREGSWWRKVWQSKIPNKIKVFVWRACLNALPTSANLSRRIQGFQAGCPLCRTEKEDVMHVLALCPFARQAWGLSSFRSSLIVSGSGDTLTWMQGVALRLDSQELSLFFCFCWALWWCRNRKLMEGKCVNPSQVPPFVSHYFEAFLAQSAGAATRSVSSIPLRWQASLSPFIKLNFDGATFNHGQEMGVGVVARDATGHLHCAVYGLEYGRVLAIRKGWRSVVLEGDCANLILKLQSPKTVPLRVLLCLMSLI